MKPLGRVFGLGLLISSGLFTRSWLLQSLSLLTRDNLVLNKSDRYLQFHYMRRATPLTAKQPGSHLNDNIRLRSIP